MITFFQSNRLLDNLFGSTQFSVPPTYYVGLSTTSINASGVGASEPVGGAYTRVAIPNNKTSWTTASSGQLTNNIQVEYPESTTSWGTITNVFIADALTGGNILYWDTLTTPRTVQPATVLIFAPNAINVQLI